MSKRKQLYVDTTFTGLIPVEPVRRILPDPDTPYLPAKYEVRVAKTIKAYKKGDLLEETAYYLVVKGRVRGYHQMVLTPKDLDERFEEAERAAGLDPRAPHPFPFTRRRISF